MSKHGIIARPSVKEMTHEAFYDNNGRYRPRAYAVIEYTFIDTEDGSEYPVEVIAEGSDTGSDKSSRKLFTQAQKIAFLQTFLISENNDSFDSDGKPELEPVNVATPKQEKKAEAESVAELTAAIGELVREGKVDASIVNRVGQRVSDAILGAGKKPTEWKKDARVLEKLVAEIKKGEIE
jgi:hypothetical protein